MTNKLPEVGKRYKKQKQFTINTKKYKETDKLQSISFSDETLTLKTEEKHTTKMLEDLEKGWYFMKVKVFREIDKKLILDKEEIDVRKLQFNCNDEKYFAQRYVHEELSDFELIKQDYKLR